MSDLDDDELLEALGIEVGQLKPSTHSVQEERVIAGFEEILRFYQTHGRPPVHGEERDLFERLYAVRLDQLRRSPQAVALLAVLDSPGLLQGNAGERIDVDSLDEDALLAELGIDHIGKESGDINVLRHVRSSIEIRAAEEVANRKLCEDFDRYQPLFEQAERELKTGVRRALRFKEDASIEVGDVFILGGQLALVASMGEQYRTPNNEANARLRVVFSNGTESDLLLRSLQRALYKDDTGRRLSGTEAGPLFGDEVEPEDIESGTIYVLRSRSDHPFVAAHRELIHKIGVTGGSVQTRIAGASRDPTYLLADVEVVAVYKLHNVSRVKLENLFHRLFGAAQIELSIDDRFGNQVKPREWFLVPLHVIDEAVKRIHDGSITDVVYDPKSARLVG